MYEHEGLQDIFFIMLYGGAALTAVLASLYLLLTRGNMMTYTITPSTELRRWAAAFMVSVAASHVWWVVLGIHWLADDQLLRNIIAIMLDRLTFVPLMMVVLVRMLQDRRRPLWPIAVAILPIAVIAVVSIVTRYEAYELITEWYSIFIGLVFIVYMVHAVRQYGRWLHDNYADLEYKEVWQSLLLLVCILFIYIAYASNEGSLATEYLAQINTLVIIAFILWRVETLQKLDVSEPSTVQQAESMQSESFSEDNKKALGAIGDLLVRRCETTHFYLLHDITLQQLATVLGTNRTYLSAYFTQQGITYSAYINRLRIEHFIRLYRENAAMVQATVAQPGIAAADARPVTAQELARQCGYRSYSTFSTNFKSIKGISVAEWMKKENISSQSDR